MTERKAKATARTQKADPSAALRDDKQKAKGNIQHNRVDAVVTANSSDARQTRG
jgi:hypothetical protein